MQFQPYLMFDGTCAEAMKFYERVIGGKLEAMLKYSEMPEPCADMPAGSGDRIAHACLVSDGAMLMESETMPGQPYEGMKNYAGWVRIMSTCTTCIASIRRRRSRSRSRRWPS